MPKTVHEALNEAIEKIKTYEGIIERINSSPLSPATVVRVVPDKNKIVISVRGGLSLVEKPEVSVKVGDVVTVFDQTGQVVDVFPCDVAAGPIVLYDSRIDPDTVMISDQGGKRMVFGSREMKIEDGDRLVLDPGGFCVIGNIGRDEVATVSDEVNVCWNDIAGLSEIKDELVEMIETPHLMKDLYAAYGYTTPKGLLLLGPPGCGKTMIGKAAATSMRKVYGGPSSFIYVKGPELLDKYVGNTESKIRDLFTRARRHFARHGTPAIIFVDEAESLLSARGGDGTSQASVMTQTVVPQFLTEMDGIDESGAIVILATNRPDKLDPAVVREGRIDRKFEVKRPTKEAVAEIVKLNTAKVKTDFTGEDVADVIFGPDQVVFHAVGVDSSKRANILVSDMVSGSMVVNIVNRAKGYAVRRDVKNSAKTPSGVTLSDVVESVSCVRRELSTTNQDEAVSTTCTQTHGFNCKSYQPAV